MEKLCDDPIIIFDGAHNEPAIKNLKEMVDMYYKNYTRTYIISILKTKDYRKMLQLLSEDKDARFLLTSGDNSEKYVTKEDLYDYAKNFIPKQNLHKVKLQDALSLILKEKNDSIHLVVGSFYVYEIVKKSIVNVT